MILLILISMSFSGDVMEIITKDNERVTYLHGNVVIKSRELTIHSQKAYFYNQKGYVVIKEDLGGEMKNGRFRCDSIVYILRERKSLLMGNAEIEIEDIQLKSELFQIEHDKKIIYTDTSVKVIDRRRNFTLTGKEGQYNYVENYGFISGEPLINYENGITISSDTFFIYKKSEKVEGKRNVVINFEDGRVKGKHIVYFYREGYGVISDSISVKKGNTVSTMDSLYFYGNDKKIDSLSMKGNVKMETLLEGGDRVKVESKSGKVIIRDKKMERIIFTGRPKGVYTPE